MKLWSVGRSLATRAALGARRTRATRLRPLDLAALDDLAPDELDRLRNVVAPATLVEHQAAMAAGTYSSVELTLHHLARIAAVDDTLHSILEVHPGALDDARASDERRRQGALLGPLDGIPITVKGNIEQAAPMHTSAGAMVLADHVATADAPIVSALRAAGAVILGSTNLSELAGAVVKTPGVSAVGGATRNPFGDFSPGGSSSGSAVAVAAGLCVASVGTETAGSLVAPASYNSVVAIKPTWGMLASEGIVPLVSSQDTAGPIASNVVDAAAVLSAMGGVTIEVDQRAAQGCRVGVLRDDIVSQRSPLERTADNPALVDIITAGLRDAGAEVVDAVIDAAVAKKFEGAFMAFVFGGLAHDTMAYLAAHSDVRTLDDLHRYNLADPARRMPKGQFFVDLAIVMAPDEAAYHAAAEQHRATTAGLLDAALNGADVDVLVSISNRHSVLYATAGYSAVTVPIGRRSNGMPVGATLIGRPGADAQLVSVAAAFERATERRVVPVQ